MGEARSLRRPHGTYFDFDGKEVGDTMQCPHCNAHFLFTNVLKKYSKTCHNCMAVTCGKRSCWENCTPFEKKIEDYEKGIIRILD